MKLTTPAAMGGLVLDLDPVELFHVGPSATVALTGRTVVVARAPFGEPVVKVTTHRTTAAAHSAWWEAVAMEQEDAAAVTVIDQDAGEDEQEHHERRLAAFEEAERGREEQEVADAITRRVELGELPLAALDNLSRPYGSLPGEQDAEVARFELTPAGVRQLAAITGETEEQVRAAAARCGWAEVLEAASAPDPLPAEWITEAGSSPTAAAEEAPPMPEPDLIVRVYHDGQTNSASPQTPAGWDAMPVGVIRVADGGYLVGPRFAEHARRAGLAVLVCEASEAGS